MTTTLFLLTSLTPALTNPGLIAPAAKLAFYLTNTTTLATVYDDDGDPISQAVNAHGVYGVEADAFGRFPNIYTDDATTYRVRLCTALGVQIGDDLDPYVGGYGGSGGAARVGWKQTGSGAVDRTVNDKLLEAPESNADFDGGTGSVDNTTPFTTLLSSRSAGVYAFNPSGNTKGNFTINQDAVLVEGPIGCVELDNSDPRAVGLRPALTGAGTATVKIGGSTNQVRRVTFTNCEISGDNGSGGMAESTLLLKSLANGSFNNVELRDGTRTLDIVPQEGPAVTTTHFDNLKARNSVNSADARLIRILRGGPTSDLNYVTAVTFAQSHFNGPPGSFAIDQQGLPGVATSYSQTYMDVKPWKGAFIADANLIHGYFAQIDPGALHVPVVETAAAVGTDPTRIVAGSWRIGDQQIKYRRGLATGSIAGNVLTVTSITGTIVAGDDVSGFGIDHTNGGVDPTGATHITINAFGSGSTTGTGGVGTYQLSISQPTLSGDFSVGPVVDIPSEMEWFFYRPCINNGYVRGALQFDNAAEFGLGPKLVGSGTELRTIGNHSTTGNVQVLGGNASVGAVYDADNANGGARITAFSTVSDANVRLVPKGAGYVTIGAGSGILPLSTTLDIGSSGGRFRTIYLQNNPDVSSDRDLKDWHGHLNDNDGDVGAQKDAYLAAAKDITQKVGFFTWKEGDDATWHCSVIAQDVVQAFIDAGLETSMTGPFKHSMFKYDDKNGYSVVYAELQLLMTWAMHERLNALEAA